MMRAVVLIWLSISASTSICGAKAHAYLYAAQGGVAVRSRPSPSAKVLGRLHANQTVWSLEQNDNWVTVAADRSRGYVERRQLSSIWIRVWKRERQLHLMDGRQVKATYRIALSATNPVHAKRKRGDSGTPEGRYYLARTTPRPPRARYGARSMRLSYPGVHDARRALAARSIDYATYTAISQAIKRGAVPPQHTPLGGSLRIHGGGSAHDWTLGCIALKDTDAVQLYSQVKTGTRVEIYRSARQEQTLGAAEHLAHLVLRGAQRQLARPARYTSHAMKALRISFPGGDIDDSEAVCTDIVIRALRRAGLDLQALVHEDILWRTPDYLRRGQRPNPHIDHRRARNLATFLARYAEIPTRGDYRPGDLVLMETGIRNGTPFDHIGVVGDRRDAAGQRTVINIWTVGERTSSMALLNKPYPQVTGHFRLRHPFETQ